ncbi:unnamed protein product, partial [Prorocentrum cordatum]
AAAACWRRARALRPRGAARGLPRAAMRAAGALRPVPGRGAQPPPRSPGAALPCDLSPVPEGGGRWALREGG